MTAPTLRREEPAAPETAAPDSSRPPTTEPQDQSILLWPTFLAAAAILTGATALGTPVSGGSWVLPMVEVVSVIWLVGLGARLIRLPTTATTLLQLLGFLVALTSLFTTSGIGGVLPDRSAVLEAGTLLSGAWAQIVGTVAPAPSTPELSFLIALAVGCAAFLADFLVAQARASALVALPLLCLYSVPASIAGTMLPWYSFAVPAVLYALLLAATGHPARGIGVRPGAGVLLDGALITAAATAAALLVAGAIPGIGTSGRLPHTNGAGGGAIGLSPLAAMRGSLAQSDPVDVLTVSGLKEPSYLRTVALTTYTANQGWSLGPLEADVDGVTGPLRGLPLPTDTRVTVRTQGYQDRFLPILNGTTAVSGLHSDSWNFDAALNTVYRSEKIRPGDYVLSASLSRPTTAELEADSVESGGSLTATGSLASSVRNTAAQVTAAASGAFDKARALEQWFTDPANGFSYSLDVPAGNSGDALVDFLDKKQGYCEQYAAAMGVMLRALNIPSRVVIGFSQGTKQSDGSYLITSHDAHAWVEVKFSDNGWVAFDPTPPVAGQGGQQGFADPAQPSTSTSASTAASAALTGDRKRLDAGETSRNFRTSVVSAQADGSATSAAAGSTHRFLWYVLVLTGVVAAGLTVPTFARRRRRARRLNVARAGGPGAATAAWAEIEDTAIDHGLLLHAAESARVRANRVAGRAHLNTEGRAQIRAVVVAAEHEWYGSAATPGPAVGSQVSSAAPSRRGTATGEHPGLDATALGAGATAPLAARSFVAVREAPLREAPLRGATVPQALVPQAPVPQATVPQAPVPQAIGGSAGSATGLAASEGATLVAGVRSAVAGLAAHTPVRGIERLFPRSLRRSLLRPNSKGPHRLSR